MSPRAVAGQLGRLAASAVSRQRLGSAQAPLQQRADRRCLLLARQPWARGGLLFEQAARVHAVEIRSGATLVSAWIAPARRFGELDRTSDSLVAKPILVWGGKSSFALHATQVASWRVLR